MRSRETRSYGASTSRRRFVQGVGVLGAAGMAGCLGDDDDPGTDDGDGGDGDDGDDGDGDDGGDPGGDPIDDTFSASTWTVPGDAQYNPYNFAEYPHLVGFMLYDGLAQYNHRRAEFVPGVAENWSVDQDAEKAVLELSGDHTWHDGESLTAADVATQLKLETFMGRAIGEHVAAVEATDETTVELTLDGAVNPSVLEHQLLPTRIRTTEAVFGEYVERFESAETDEESEEVQGDLGSESLDYEEAPGNGPFAITDVAEGRILMEPFGEYRTADSINFPNYEYRHIAGNESNWSAMEGGEIDGTTFFAPQEVFDGFPDTVVHSKWPRYSDLMLIFKHNDEHYGDVRVRKAIAHVVDRQLVAESAGAATKVAVEIPDGVPGDLSGQASEWLGEHADSFNRYERDEARATELLEDAGYQKDGDQWVDEGGDPIDATITAPAGWSDWVSGAEVAQELLQSFGFQSDLETVDATTYMGDTRPNADFTLGTWAWGGAGEPYPYFSLSYGMSSSDARNISQYPEEVEAPPLGEPDGELETVRPGDLVEQLAVAGEGEDEELIQELAWIYNQTLPVLPLIDGMNQGWTNRENWEFPDDDAPELGVNAPYHWLPRVGALQAKTE